MQLFFAVVSAKGQLVIPSAMRAQLVMQSGTRVALRIEGSRIILQPVMARLLDLGIAVMPAIGERAIRSARIRARHGIPYADGYDVQLAAESSDRNVVPAEFDLRPAATEVQIEFLPIKGRATPGTSAARLIFKSLAFPDKGKAAAGANKSVPKAQYRPIGVFTKEYRGCRFLFVSSWSNEFVEIGSAAPTPVFLQQSYLSSEQILRGRRRRDGIALRHGTEHVVCY